MSSGPALGREDIFKELGLWPVWRMRSTPASNTKTNVVPEIQTDDQAKPVIEIGKLETTLSWDALRQAVDTCTRCKLHKTRIQGVFGIGDQQADWLIVGEAPGADEDAQGEPFVGQAGRLLDAMLTAIGLRRGDNVYIANVLKSRPPGNRNPEPDEIAACMPYLLQQIELLQPKIIVAMGRFAAQNLLASKDAIANLRGRVHHFHGVPLIVTYHPAYLLRTLPDKAKAWEDLCLARQTYATLQSNAPIQTNFISA